MSLRSLVGSGALWRTGGLHVEKNEGGGPHVLRFSGARTGPPSASLEEDCAGLSTAAFQRFLRAANHSSVAPRRRRTGLTVLALGLITAVALIVVAATRRREEGTARAADAAAARLAREVCQARSGITGHHGEAFEEAMQNSSGEGLLPTHRGGVWCGHELCGTASQNL
jgi:hypothetical protein